MHHYIHTPHKYVHINTFKATTNIAAGQEIFIQYGSAQWFESKKLSYADVDYASTMWRPGLHPLPCRRKVVQTTGADGRHNFAVLKAAPSGTILEISLCLEVSVTVVDQFPFLWDFVLTGETGHEYIGCLLPADFCLLTRIYLLFFFADQAKGFIRERAERVCMYIIYIMYNIFVSLLTFLFQFPNP